MPDNIRYCWGNRVDKKTYATKFLKSRRMSLTPENYRNFQFACSQTKLCDPDNFSLIRNRSKTCMGREWSTSVPIPYKTDNEFKANYGFSVSKLNLFESNALS